MSWVKHPYTAKLDRHLSCVRCTHGVTGYTTLTCLNGFQILSELESQLCVCRISLPEQSYVAQVPYLVERRWCGVHQKAQFIARYGKVVNGHVCISLGEHPGLWMFSVIWSSQANYQQSGTSEPTNLLNLAPSFKC